MTEPSQDELSRLAFVALGSNLGDSDRLVTQAMTELAQLAAAPILRSSLWKTSPVDCPPGSPEFINGVVGLVPSGNLSPEEFLNTLQGLEQDFGRSLRRTHHEPRPLDLDLLAWGTQVMATPRLTLPHPRAHQRRFVLEPFCELAPDLVLPGQTEPIRTLLARLSSTEKVERLPDSGISH